MLNVRAFILGLMYQKLFMATGLRDMVWGSDWLGSRSVEKDQWVLLDSNIN